MKYPWLDAHEIVPNLWQGAHPERGLLLRKAGFDTLVLCAAELQTEGIYYPGLRVAHAPNFDHPRIPLTAGRLEAAVRAARGAAADAAEGKRVLVTCAAGLNRSGLVVAIALHILSGWPGEKCIAQIRTKRTSRREPNLEPLCNDEFAEVVRQLNLKGPELDAVWIDSLGELVA